MPKSRQRKKRSKPTRPNRGYEVVKLTDEIKAALETQFEAFRKKFGRTQVVAHLVNAIQRLTGGKHV